MKNFTLGAALSVILLLTFTVSRAQIMANSVISSNNVANPGNAADADTTNYATLQAPIGIANSADITLGFSQLGIGGMTCAVEIQRDGGLLDANILKTLTITLYNNKDSVVGEKSGTDFSSVDVGDGTSRVKLYVPSKDHARNIASVKIKVNGLATAVNGIRLYFSILANHCPRIFGDVIHDSHNVQNPDNAITDDNTDYALLTPPIIAGNSYLDIEFSLPGRSGVGVAFTLGQGNKILSLSLLQGITIDVYDTTGQVVASKSDFVLADAEVLANGRFKLAVKTPIGSYEIGRARITFANLVSLTTLKAYNVSYSDDSRRPQKPVITASGSTTFCNGDSVLLKATPYSNTIPRTYQWYRNGSAIIGATTHLYVAKIGGQYSVAITKDGCPSNPSVAVIVMVHHCLAGQTISTAQVYPNPFHSFTTINFDGALKGNLSITISDKTGRVVEAHQISGAASLRILTNASPGIYFVKIVSGDSVTTKTVEKL